MQQCLKRKLSNKGNLRMRIHDEIWFLIEITFFLLFRVSISPDPTEKTAKKINISNESKTIDIEEEIPTTPLPPHRESSQPERTRLIVFGVAKIQKTRLLATLSGLKV